MASWLGSSGSSVQADSGHGLIHDALATFIPAPVLHIAALFSNLVYRLVIGQDNDPDSLRSTLLPPLITLGLIYVALVTAYRMLRSTIALAFFALKWGAILALVFGIWAYWSGESGAALSEGTPGNRPMWQKAFLPDLETLIDVGLGTAAQQASRNNRRGRARRGFGDAGADAADDLAGRLAQGLVDEILPPRQQGEEDPDDDGWSGLDTFEALLPSVGLRLKSIRAVQAATQALMANLGPTTENLDEAQTRPKRKNTSGKGAGSKKATGSKKVGSTKKRAQRSS